MINKFPIIDLHQDLLSHIRFGEQMGQNKQTDFEMIEQSNIKCVTATAFPFPPEKNFFDPITNNLIEEELTLYNQRCDESDNWRIIKSKSDFDNVISSPDQFGLILHIEGLNVFPENGWEMLEKWYELGLRSIAPVWNLSNPFGGGTKDYEKGLTDLGIKLIEFACDKNMLFDFAHMNESTFYQAADLFPGPILVSHANCASVFPSPRNLTDNQLRLIADRNGTVGVFFAKTFLTKEKTPTIQDVADQVDHMREIMGVTHIGLGTDFGGILSGCPDNLESVLDLPNLFAELTRRGYTSEEIERPVHGVIRRKPPERPVRKDG